MATLQGLSLPIRTRQRGANITLRRRSSRASSTAPPENHSPEDDLNKAPARPSTTRPRKPRVTLSRRSLVSSLPTLPDPNNSEQHGRRADSSNVYSAYSPSSLELDGNKNATEGPHGEDEAVPARCHGFRTAGIDASPHNNHTACQGSVNLLEPTSDAPLIQPPQCEAQCDAAESTYASCFGELIDGGDHKQADQTKSESETHRKAPLLVNNQILGVEPVGEAVRSWR
jgi:hypothetical protein